MTETSRPPSKPPLVSVVTPFFNTAAHLETCILSVLSQTYAEWEYLLIDNHSDDGSSEIAAKYAAREPRIRLIRPPFFLAQIPNFNYGLEHIDERSEYCKFILADDYLLPRCLEEMVKAAETNPRIGLVSSYRFTGNRIRSYGLEPGPVSFPGREIGRSQLLKKTVVFGSQSTLMFRSAIVRARRPFFDAGSFHPDTDACYEILREWDFGFVHQVLSYTRMDDSSTIGSKRRYLVHLTDFFLSVEKYARVFLSGREYERCLKSNRLAFYGFLIRAALLGEWSPGFWSFQKRELKAAGVVPHWPTAWQALLETAFELAANPKMTLGRLIRVRRRRGGLE